MNIIFEIVSYNFEFLIRLFLAACCGAIIGYERTSKHKEAGVRTHVIVAISSCLMVIISKYGFFDSYKFDASRIAAQIVTGVGFLGAGIIFVKDKVTVSGLTTAAGIWGTAGVGMAVGSGLYVLGFISSVFMVITNLFLRNNTLRDHHKFLIIEIITNDKGFGDFNVKSFLKANHLVLVSYNKYDVHTDQKISIKASYDPDDLDIDKILIDIKKIENIKSQRINFI